MNRDPAVRLGAVWRASANAAVSLLCAGAVYAVWLAAFLLATRLNNSILQAAGWLSAPVVTAAGFAVGIALSERVITARKSRFLYILAWPLIGCTVGAAAVYWFGPMLIVFGMFAAGTASIVLREVYLHLRGARDPTIPSR